MRFHNNQLEPIRQALSKIFFEGIKDHMAVAFMLESNKKWGSKDRKLASKCVYDIVRYWRRYWYSIDAVPTAEIIEIKHLIALWIALQSDEIAEVFDLEIAAISKWKQLFESIDDFVIRESVSDELNILGIEELGTAQWQTEMQALNKEAAFTIRVNTSKAKIDSVATSLLQEGIETSKVVDVPTALVMHKRANIQRSPTFLQGVFEIQDVSSQLIVPFMDIQADTIVIDACAGAGGKTMHIADVLRNSGRIIAMDVEPNKLKELKRRAERNRFTKIDVHLIQNEQSVNAYADKADRLLLDVPCTGSGVLRRNADDKYKISRSSFITVQDKQRSILSTYPIMLKRGAVFVYATCSIFPSENEKQIEWFLSKNPNFSLIEQKTVFPSVSGFDGFFMAKLQKN